MPYDMIFTGSFFHIADFIQGIDSLVQTENPELAVDGRLMTINGFSLEGKPLGLPEAASELLGHHLRRAAGPGPDRVPGSGARRRR